MDFGFEIKETNGNLMINFKHEIENWKRYVSELIRDRVIFDIKNAEKFLNKRGDEIVYEVYNLWKSVGKFKKIFERTDIVCDVTHLNFGVFSVSDKGELFSTYGHAHEKEYGEAYTVLKNNCFLILSDRKTHNTFIILLKEGDSIFIHPKFLHRLVSYKRDSLVVGLVPKEAGHNYSVIKNKGFPFHLLYDKKKGKIQVKKNKIYKKANYKMIKRIKTKINPIKLLERKPEKLKDILENPEKHKKVYFIKK